MWKTSIQHVHTPMNALYCLTMLGVVGGSEQKLLSAFFCPTVQCDQTCRLDFMKITGQCHKHIAVPLDCYNWNTVEDGLFSLYKIIFCFKEASLLKRQPWSLFDHTVLTTYRKWTK